jgi:hypothetical protein
VRAKRQPSEPGRTDGVSLTRRGMLGGLAASAIPVFYGIESASSALAAPAPVDRATRPGGVPNASDGLVRRNGADDLVRGGERRYNAPLLNVRAYVLELPVEVTGSRSAHYLGNTAYFDKGHNTWVQVQRAAKPNMSTFFDLHQWFGTR